MARYLAHLRRSIFQDGPVLLLLDTYSAHRAKIGREAARICNIDFLFIPPGGTDRLQPLDRRVFGVLKAYARSDWRARYHGTAGAKVTRAQMAEFLVAAWDQLRTEVIEAAWSIYADVNGWGDDEESEADDANDMDYVERLDVRDIRDL
jgi:hypothetical protein